MSFPIPLGYFKPPMRILPGDESIIVPPLENYRMKNVKPGSRDPDVIYKPPVKSYHTFHPLLPHKDTSEPMEFYPMTNVHHIHKPMTERTHFYTHERDMDKMRNVNPKSHLISLTHQEIPKGSRPHWNSVDLQNFYNDQMRNILPGVFRSEIGAHYLPRMKLFEDPTEEQQEEQQEQRS